MQDRHRAFAMQSLWSNAANRCIMTASPGDRDQAGDAEVDDRRLGQPADHCPTNTHSPSTFKASGLPPGLSISTAGRSR